MYRRNYRSDELISNVIVTLIASLIIGFMISWKLVGVDTFDAEMIVYLSIGGLLFILFVITVILFFIGNRKPFVDLEIDFENEIITTLNRTITYHFKDISLFSYNTRHHQVRLYVKRRLLGFSIDEMEHRKQGIMTVEQAMKIGRYAMTVEPKKLYNYGLLLNLVWIGIAIFYIIYFGRNQVALFNNVYIPTYYAFVFIVVMVGLTIGVHSALLNRMISRKETTQDTSNN
ncbi:hypothetical protein [Candidatus Xianfuyuplasma coldseepsis]|uniref:Uncharacterized protein n=1 Tax=Candidatus Xianfuyuplasma coldseepsis TaxID=2782163 RepID=A0A7L7KSB5_9MOLU|nr:hypothetical protein [Xianfuyuplasma coldseepsis]QMS85495.1 hypothetical protein G4Z02_06985 [Xianfuyuplasma coldseepsis]